MAKPGYGHAMAETPLDPHAYPALYLLRTQMQTRGYTCHLDSETLTVVAPVSDGPRLADEIVCKPRQRDDGRLYFWTSGGRPLAPIDKVEDAALTIVTLLKPSGRTDETRATSRVMGPGAGINV